MDYQNFSINLARQAGALIKQSFFTQHTTEWKGDEGPVTEVDLKIHKIVEDQVKSKYPTFGFLSEEGKTNPNHGHEYVWICDPLDGTYPYIHGIPTATFSLALLHFGKPIAGLIYDPFMNRMLYAEEGQGATLNGESIFVCEDKDLTYQPVGVSLWGKAKYDLSPLVTVLQKKLALPLNLGAIIYGGALTASGKMIAAVYNDDKPHDGAAVKIIVEEAGGKVTDLYGNDILYNQSIKGMLASNGAVHDELLQIITENLPAIEKS